MDEKEYDFLRRELSRLRRPKDSSPALLARLVESREYYGCKENTLPTELDAHADDADRKALGIARDAAELAAIGARYNSSRRWRGYSRLNVARSSGVASRRSFFSVYLY